MAGWRHRWTSSSGGTPGSTGRLWRPGEHGYSGGGEDADGSLQNFELVFGPALTVQSDKRTRNGAYLPGSQVANDARGMLVAGPFADNKTTLGGIPSPAASLIRWTTSRYAWSHRFPEDAEERGFTTGLSNDDGVVRLVSTPDALRTQWLDTAGNPGGGAGFERRACALGQAVLWQGQAYVAGRACDDSRGHYLLRVPREGVAIVTEEFPAEGSLVLSEAGHWQYIREVQDGLVVEMGGLDK